MARKSKGQGQILSGSPSPQFTNFQAKTIQANRAPTTADIGYEIGQQWADSTNNILYGLASVSAGSAQWNLLGPGSSDVDTLTGDSGGAIAPTGGNINILGGDGLTVVGSGSTLTINRDAQGGYPITPFVVGSSGEAGYTTIQAAISAASSAGGGMVYIQPGTYTEDLTLADGVHLVSVIYENAFEVIIAGTHTPPASGSISFRGIQFTDATAIFSSIAAGSTSISCEECTFGVTNGYTFDLTNWTGPINCNDCGSTGTNDGFVNNSGGSTIFTNNGQFGAGTTKTFTANGDVRLDLTFLDCPADISGGNIFVNFALFSKTITCSGTSTGAFLLINSFPTAAPAFVITSVNPITIENSTITTSNDPAIDGTGSVSVINTGFGDNANFAPTLTVGTGSTFVDGTFSTLIPAAHLEMSGTAIAGLGSDANISVTITPKGTGDFIVDQGDIQNTSGDIIATHSSAGADVTLEATNSDNTSSSSRAGVEIATGGASSGDPYLSFQISGVGASTMTMGLDNSASDLFVVSNSTTLGTSNALTLSQAGALNATTSVTAGTTLTATLGDITATNGNLVFSTAGNKISSTNVGSGTSAGANSFGTTTLTGGTATVSTTAVTANSIIYLTRTSVGATGAAPLGMLTVGTITPATSFVINAWDVADATSLAATDVSVVGWMIVN